MRECVLYARVSTSKQARFGISLDSQQEALLKWASYNKAQIVKAPDGSDVWVERGRSGGTMRKRPVFLGALASACKNKAALVGTDLTRMSRSLVDLFSTFEQLQKSGADIVIVGQCLDTTTPNGRLMFGLLGLIAQYYREITRSKSVEMHDYLEAHGLPKGQPPYGWRLSRGVKKFGSQHKHYLVEDAYEQMVLQIIRDLSMQNGFGCKRVADWLNANGLRPRQDRVLNQTPMLQSVWHPSSVQYILGREKAARAASKGKAVPDERQTA